MFKCLDNDFPELPSQYQVNDEVYGSIEDQSEMIEAGQAEKPGRGGGRKPHTYDYLGQGFILLFLIFT